MDPTAWTFDPAVLIGVSLAGGLYARGWRRLRQRSVTAVKPADAPLFSLGLAALVLALCSPIGTYDQQLFSLHMVEHLLLTLVAPPLLLLGRPLLPILWGLPTTERRGAARLLAPRGLAARIVRTLARPQIALTMFVISFGAWHVPALYDAAQGQSVVHYIEHATFFVTALLFWWPVIHPSGGPRTLSKFAAIGYFSVPMFEGTLIGALLTFASRPFYDTYAAAPRMTTLSAVDDQQLAGLIMWIPGGLVYVVAILWLLSAVLREGQEAADDLPRSTPQPRATPLPSDDPVLLERA